MPVRQKVLDSIRVSGKDVPFNWREIESSNVAWIGWPLSGEPLMVVQYHSGNYYGYIGVPRQKAVAAANARSTGSYIHRHIRGKYRPVRLKIE